MNAIVVYNEQAGKSGDDQDRPNTKTLQEAFRASGEQAVIRGASGKDIERTLREAVAQAPDSLFVGGGDGTLSTAAGLLAGTNIALGVLPLGTLNHFAQDLGIPLNWREAVVALTGAPTRNIDVAEVNGRVFINNCSIGSYADAVRRRDALRKDKGHGKQFAMLLASWAVFRESRRHRLQIATPDGSLALRTPFLFVANNRYTGSVFAPSLRPRLDEGLLWLYTTRAYRTRALLRLAWQTMVRHVDAADDLEVHDLTAATVTVPRGHLPIAADGELLNIVPPLHFKVRPGALRVKVPLKTTAQ